MKALSALRGSIVTAVVVGVLAVSGCATADTALVVNDEHISSQELQEAVSQLNTAAPGANLDNATALTLLLRARFTQRVADSAGKGLSDSQVVAALKTDKLNAAAIDIVRTSDAFNPQNPSVLSQAEQGQVLTELEKADITLNPRYGRLDRKNWSVGPGTPNWIKEQPAPTEAPAAPTPQG
ncbi:hypothetical protein [Pedococcus bigeumensis]|uniref:Lipoprotein n=1 Tax=Pedococcus bigeumensis TaxID=433644 RepID=A0A502D284_9MICO|nr:hypothetical protein [Pedococcus bigeumensis]TPG18972.1 hypothetical protein EAH86_00060 [Pedococcus bigeumensis]